MIVAINKVDKPNANPDKIREQLSAMNILVAATRVHSSKKLRCARFSSCICR